MSLVHIIQSLLLLAVWAASRCLPKKPTAVAFSDIHGKPVVLVADKVGDVRAYLVDDLAR